MEIDPVDDGPKQDPSAMIMSNAAPPKTGPTPPVAMSINHEDDARQAIEMLRGDDVAERVAAATRLEGVATALGEERTREVCHAVFVYTVGTDRYPFFYICE